MNAARFIHWFALAASLLLTACQSEQTTRSGEIGVDRKQSMTTLVSSREVEQQASQEYAQVLAGARKKGLLNQDPQQVQRVRAIAARLIPQVSVFRDDAPKWKWEVNVLTSKDINAWCMPGGKIAVYTGLIERLDLTDAELAAVMGHEIAHALREHARERMSRQMATQAGTAIGAVALEAPRHGGQAPGTIELQQQPRGIRCRAIFTEPERGRRIARLQAAEQILDDGAQRGSIEQPRRMCLRQMVDGQQPLVLHEVDAVAAAAGIFVGAGYLGIGRQQLCPADDPRQFARGPRGRIR